MVLTQEFFNHLLILVGLMYGFTTIKVSVCKPFMEDGEEFSWKKLFQGTLRQLLVISGIMVVFYTGCKCGENLLLVQIGETKLTLQTAIDVTILSVATYYAAKYIKNLAVFFGIGDKLNDKNVKELNIQDIVDYNVSSDCCSSSHCNCKHGKLIGYVYAADNCECTCNDKDDQTDDVIDTNVAVVDEEEKG